MSPEDLLLVIAHGISARPVICSFASLKDSNGQLHDTKAPASNASSTLGSRAEWLIPEGGPELSGFTVAPSADGNHERAVVAGDWAAASASTTSQQNGAAQAESGVPCCGFDLEV